MKVAAKFSLRVKKYVFVIVGLAFSMCLLAQELPPVSVYSPEDYLADNQNWSISQDSKRHIFVANNRGLLEYDGVDWRLYPSPNESIIRAVHCSGDTVFSGCYRDFGFWVRDSKGYHKYQSLLEGRDWEMGEDEQIWKIVEFEDHYIFQSLSAIYIYQPQTNTISQFRREKGITRIFHKRNDLYVAVTEEGIYRLEKDGFVLVSDEDVFINHLVVGMYDIDGELYVQTNTAGVFNLHYPRRSWASPFFEQFEEMKVYSSYQSEDGTIFIGTVSRGLFSLSKEGELKYGMSRANSLSNNTILNIFEDEDTNIWLALDNGVNVIHRSSPMRIYYDDSGYLGTVYSSIIFNNRLYLGTNQGLFYRSLDESSSPHFTLVSGSIGQVWSLYEHNGTLFCGHDNGTFTVQQNSLKLIDDFAGTWCFRVFPGDTSRLLVGHYKGLSILRRTGKGWVMNSPLSNYDFSTRHVEFVSDSLILVNHEYKGVFKVEVDIEPGNETINSVEKDTSVDRGLYSSLSRIDGKAYYAYEEGVFYYDVNNGMFKRDSLLSHILLAPDYSSGKIVSATIDYGAWIFSSNGIHLVRPGKLKDEREIISIPIPSHHRNAMLGYENILQIDYGKFLFGHAGGYFLFDLDIYKESNPAIPIRLRSATAITLQDEIVKMPLDEENVVLKPDFNSVSFEFSMPGFESYFLAEYQYKLEGYIENWSSWQPKNQFEVSNLSYGDYTLNVRGRVGDKKSSPVLSYDFSISRPFWLSKGMILLYFLVGILLLIGIHFKYKSYYERERKREQRKNQRKQKLTESENKRKFIRLQNEKLQQEIESKNRELAISTMGIIKKNRFLNKIKKELKQTENNDAQVGKVIKIIDKNLRSNDDWEFFEKAFNDADKDFFKKVKKRHPELTNNDLRFCAYLRLNLSSKEVAPLLSISPKSVEVKRYRLRKKMNLDGETNLTDYILSI